jgi:hypothetical protein
MNTQFINSHLDGGFLWPAPLVQLNPAFVEGLTIDELVAVWSTAYCRITLSWFSGEYC